MLNLNLSFSENTVDPDHLASTEAIRSGSTLFSTLIENTYLKLECCREQCSTYIVHDKG